MKNAEEKAPSRKYFSAASCDSSLRRRARPASRYSGSERISSATNMTSRVFDAANSIMPATANDISGYASVWVSELVCCARAPRLPGTIAARATSDPTRGSATNITEPMPSARMVPSRNSAGPSIATAPAASNWRLECSRRDRDQRGDEAGDGEGGCTMRRSLLGTKASIRTAGQCDPKTISIGDSAPYWSDGALILSGAANSSGVISGLRSKQQWGQGRVVTFCRVAFTAGRMMSRIGFG